MLVPSKNPEFGSPTVPPTIDHATKPSEFKGKVEEGKKCHRPGGMYRGSKHGFKTIACDCNNHPCTCGTSDTESIHGHTNASSS